jgi:hypothetical protein
MPTAPACPFAFPFVEAAEAVPFAVGFEPTCTMVLERATTETERKPK